MLKVDVNIDITFSCFSNSSFPDIFNVCHLSEEVVLAVRQRMHTVLASSTGQLASQSVPRQYHVSKEAVLTVIRCISTVLAFSTSPCLVQEVFSVSCCLSMLIRFFCSSPVEEEKQNVAKETVPKTPSRYLLGVYKKPPATGLSLSQR